MKNEEIIDLTKIPKEEICHIKCRQRKDLQKELQQTKAKLEKAKSALEEIERKRNAPCLIDGCTCLNDYAFYALKELKESE